MQIFKVNNFALLIGILTMIVIATFLIVNFGDRKIIHNIKVTETQNDISAKNLFDSNNEFKKLNLDFKYLNEFEVIEGDTFASILQSSSIPNNEISEIVKELNEYIDLSKLNIGAKINILSEHQNENKIWHEISISNNLSNKIIISKKNSSLEVREEESQLFSKFRYIETSIETSIYQSLKNQKIADNIIMDFVQLFSFDVDFQRDIRNGNRLKLFYEEFVDNEQVTKKFGPIYFAEISLDRDDVSLYRFHDKGAEFVEYFDENGKSATKALMKTPINGARLSSGFGMRKHPILGYNKKHQGVDFAAPTGTPIMAAGNGHIEFVGTNGGAGKYIRIKHLNGYKTSYSHLSKYASGMKKNLRVKQGQVIGFVGSTGLSTGPHLHYEVWFNNERINPMKMKLPSGKTLKGILLDNFITQKEAIKERLVKFTVK